MAASFDNPDWVDVMLRWDEAEPDPASKWLSGKMKATKTLALPAIYLQGDLDGVNRPKTSEKVADKFIGPFERICCPGHFPAREAPAEVAERLVKHFDLLPAGTLTNPATRGPRHCRAVTSRRDAALSTSRLMGSADIGIARECRSRASA